jgi:hypothetical protein
VIDRDVLPAAFARAAAEEPGALRESWLRFAGRPVRLRAVGEELARNAVRAFVHLTAEPGEGEPELTIDLWDESATGTACPVRTGGNPNPVVTDGGPVWRHTAADAITDFDRERRRMTGWRAGADADPLPGGFKPLPLLLPLWYLDRGLPFVHGGVVARDGAGALVAGPGDRGKSTTTLACAAAGMEFLGDDQVALEETPHGGFAAHSVWSVAGLRPELLRIHPHLTGGAPVEDDGRKAIVHLGDASAVDVGTRADVRVIVLPRPGEGTESTLRPISAGRALLDVAPSSSFGYGRLGASWSLDRYERLVRRVPAFSLQWGTDLAGVVAAVEEALDRAG